MRLLAGRICVALVAGAAALAGDIPGSAAADFGVANMSRESVSPLYFGGSVAWTHHTGWVPNKNPGEAASVESWLLGGKVFGGYRFNERLSAEVGYHHLGRASYLEGFGTALAESTVRSYAISGSVLYAFPPLPRWWAWEGLPPAHFFVRGGLAYKNILQNTIEGSFEEGTLAAVLGIGIEQKLTSHWFTRLEVEHLSVAIGGPVHSAPLLKGTVNVKIGGTNHVPNVMHTQTMFTLGYRL